MDNNSVFDELIEKNKEGLSELGRELFSCPELGFKEVKSNRILTSFLEKNQIPYLSGLSCTGIKATAGSGKGIHVALVADMDALEVMDGDDHKAVHSCGHSIQTAVMAYALKMINDSGILEKTDGKVSFIATPAEEFIDFDYRKDLAECGKIRYFSGKQNMISEGVFDDVDCVISMHVNGDSTALFDIGSTLAGFMVKKYVFTGQAAHSGAAPHLGRNALHGATLCMNALAFMTEQFSKDAGIQIHPVMTHCGGSVNVIPDEAVLESYIRANTLDDLLEAGKRADRCAVHAAGALGLDCEIKNRTGYMPLKQSDRINDLVYRNMLKLCRDKDIVKNVISGASGDVGDLGYLLPTVQFGFSGIRGRIHSGDFEIINEENVYFNTARVVMNTAADLLADPSFRTCREEYGRLKQFYLKNWLNETQQAEMAKI